MTFKFVIYINVKHQLVKKAHLVLKHENEIMLMKL